MRSAARLIAACGKSARYWLLLLLRSPYDLGMTLLHAALLQTFFREAESGTPEGLWRAAAWFLLAAVGVYLFNGAAWVLYSRNAVSMLARLRRRLFDVAAAEPDPERFSASQWQQRLGSDVRAFQSALTAPMQMPFLATSVPNLAVSLALLLLLEWRMALIVVVFVVPHALLMRYAVAIPVEKRQGEALRARDDCAAKLHALADTAAAARVYGAEDWMLERFRQSSLGLREANWRVQKSQALGRLMLVTLGMTGYLAVLLAGGAFLRAGEMDFGQLTALFQLRGGVMAGFMILLSVAVSLRGGRPAMERTLETLGERPGGQRGARSGSRGAAG